MGNRILDVRDLKTYFIRRNSVAKVVDGVSFHVDENETLGLVGESGSGKTLASLSILRLVPKPGRIVEGKIYLEGLDLLVLSEKEMQKLRGGKISMILQDPMTSLNPVFTIGDQVGESIATHFKLKGAALGARVVEMLNHVRIPSPETRVNAYPHQMSGGMKQRVVGAIAMACRPKLLIADEPTTSLDVTIQAQYLELLKDLQREFGMSLIFITHDFGIVANMCDRVAVMYAGQIVETAPVQDIFYHPAHHYTAALLKAVPKLENKVDRLTSVPGQPPRLDQLSVGCRFAPRCSRADSQCNNEEPPFSFLTENHRCKCWHPIQ
ncbi:MAG: ABC transporter ATP-binding protein [Chloroflexi bacterium]|nr:ABC transporter ATP-binding protein [Chloroflexota bacterium]